MISKGSRILLRKKKLAYLNFEISIVASTILEEQSLFLFSHIIGIYMKVRCFNEKYKFSWDVLSIHDSSTVFHVSSVYQMQIISIRYNFNGVHLIVMSSSLLLNV